MDLTGRVLVLWSGGVESTALLLRLLRETSTDVVALFIEMRNSEARHDAERRAVETLLPLLREVRAFAYAEAVHQEEGPSRYDYSVQYPIAVRVMNEMDCDHLLRAGCLEDEWDRNYDLRSGAMLYVRPDAELGAAHRRRTRQLFGVPGDRQAGDRVSPYLSCYALPKAAHVAYLGGLFDHTWSCRQPVDKFRPCGKCPTCKERAAAVLGTSTIPEVAQQLEGEIA